jgi:hypothetical protein
LLLLSPSPFADSLLLTLPSLSLERVLRGLVLSLRALRFALDRCDACHSVSFRLPSLHFQSPSPTHIASVSAAHLRATYGHQRHESDTLRSAAGNLPPQQPIQPQSTSPKLSEPPQTQHVPVASGRSRRSPTTSEPVLVGGEDEVANVPVSEVRTRNLVVSKKAYARLDLIGKGGSSHVYRVTNNANETCDQTRFT